MAKVEKVIIQKRLIHFSKRRFDIKLLQSFVRHNKHSNFYRFGKSLSERKTPGVNPIKYI